MVQKHKSEKSTWWVVYCQAQKRMQKGSIGTGSRYALMTLVCTKKEIQNQRLLDIQFKSTDRSESIKMLQDLNIIDAVMEV